MGSAGSANGELREGQGGQPLHLPDGVVISTDYRGKQWRTAVEVELTRKTEAPVVAILRHLLSSYDDVVYRVHPSAMTVVTPLKSPRCRRGRSGSWPGRTRRRLWPRSPDAG